MKKIILCMGVLLAMTSLQANAFDFTSALNFLNKASEAQTNTTETVKTLSDVETQMAAIDKSVQETFLNIVSELSTRKETKNIKKELKENSDALNQVLANYAANLAANKEKVTKTISKMSSKEKTALLEELKALSEYSQKYLLLATDSVKAATTAVKSAQKFNEVATTLANVNKVATELKSRATTVVNFANQLKTIATTAGLTVN